MNILVIPVDSCFDRRRIVQCITDSNAWLKASISFYRLKTFVNGTVKFIAVNISHIFCIRADLRETRPTNPIVDLYFITQLPVILNISREFTGILYSFIIGLENNRVLFAGKNIRNEFVISI